MLKTVFSRLAFLCGILVIVDQQHSANAATILKHMFHNANNAAGNINAAAAGALHVDGEAPVTPLQSLASDGVIDARQSSRPLANKLKPHKKKPTPGNPPPSSTQQQQQQQQSSGIITEVQSSYSGPFTNTTTTRNVTINRKPTVNIDKEASRNRPSSLSLSLDARVDDFLNSLPAQVIETPLTHEQAGQIFITLFNLQKTIKAARLSGPSILTPLLIGQLVPPLGDAATATYLSQLAASKTANAAASVIKPALSGSSHSRPSTSEVAFSALGRQLNLNVNMKEMMPLIAQFLDANVKEKCSGNSTAAAEAQSDTTALLSLMTQLMSPKQEHAAAVAIVDKNGVNNKDLVPKRTPGFLSQEFVHEFFTGGNNGVNIQRMMMEIATKVLADLAAKALTGGG